MISIILPVYNEEKTIEKIIEKIDSLRLSVKKEIIVVDDGSFDKTWDILCGLKEKYSLILLQHKKNIGQGGAFKTGILKASGDIVITQDADLEYSPDDYEKLLAPFYEKGAEVVYGSRILGRNHSKRVYTIFYLGGRFLTFLTNLLYGLNITDEATGYKVFKRKLIQKLDLQCTGFEFSPEVTAKIAKLGIKIYEVPISYNPRTKEEGKKIKWIDGLIAIWTLIKFRF